MTVRSTRPSPSFLHRFSRGLLVMTAAIGAACLFGYAALARSKPDADSATKSRSAHREVPYVPVKRGTLTFAKDIAPILYKNCTTCHRPGEVAPFTLAKYEDARKRAAQIASVTGIRAIRAARRSWSHGVRRRPTRCVSLS